VSTGPEDPIPVSPADSQTIYDSRSSTAEEIDTAVHAARQARLFWRRTPPGERAKALRQAADTVRTDADLLGDLLCATTGRPLSQARDSAAVAADLLDEAAVSGLLDAGRSLAGDPLEMDTVRREPRGVIAVLTPWNDPYPAAAGLIAAALITGNTVVHKPSERSARPGWELGRRIAAALPPAVLTVLSGDGQVGARLAADTRIDLVADIGSTKTGRRIATAVGARGGWVLLENGLVDAGVDPRWAAEQIAAGAFTNTGQLCTSVERIYLHRSIADQVISELVTLAERLVVGDPRESDTDLGPLVDECQLKIVMDHVTVAVEAGATCLTGGRRLDRPGSFFPPTVLTGCTPQMPVVSQETFGPVAAVQIVDDFDGALREANSGDFGLAATVLTPDLTHALRAVDELDVGTVKINSVFRGAPGGSADPRRASGSGPGFGPALIGEFTALKAVHLEPAPATPATPR
jgi:acyl-CoA reductase-like NAD-dependent aldehyde dehydrogenase